GPLRRPYGLSIQSLDAFPPPLGLPQRSAGLTATSQPSRSVRRFFGFSSTGPRGRVEEKPKKRQVSSRGAFLVANPSLRLGQAQRGRDKLTDRRCRWSACLATAPSRPQNGIKRLSGHS